MCLLPDTQGLQPKIKNLKPVYLACKTIQEKNIKLLKILNF